MSDSQEESWRLGASLWKALGGAALATWWSDLRNADLRMAPVALQGANKDEIGKLGEDLAVHYLRREARMKILRRNFRAPRGGEVDIVCRDTDTLVFVEVKTRRSTAFGRPITAVDAAKQQLIARGAVEWLRLLGQDAVVFRFDVVEIVLEEGKKPDIERVENAFELPEPFYLPG